MLPPHEFASDETLVSPTGERVKISNDPAVAVDLNPNIVRRRCSAFWVCSNHSTKHPKRSSVDPGTIIVARLDRFHLTRLRRMFFGRCSEHFFDRLEWHRCHSVGIAADKVTGLDHHTTNGDGNVYLARPSLYGPR